MCGGVKVVGILVYIPKDRSFKSIDVVGRYGGALLEWNIFVHILNFSSINAGQWTKFISLELWIPLSLANVFGLYDDRRELHKSFLNEGFICQGNLIIGTNLNFTTKRAKL
jgi:hypothetical protein